jgi:hypothetical protein
MLQPGQCKIRYEAEVSLSPLQHDAAERSATDLAAAVKLPFDPVYKRRFASAAEASAL